MTEVSKGGSPSPQPVLAGMDQAHQGVLQREAMMAIMAVEANLDGMQGGGGYQSWTAEKAAAQLVPLMNSAQAPGPDEPGESKMLRPRFTYVADRVSAPWQVVIRAEGSNLKVEAYGSDTSKPLDQKLIPVSRY